MLTPEEARERLTAPFNINLNRWLEVPVRHSVGFKGFFKVRLIDARTGLVKRALEFPNVITDAGFDALGDDSTWINDFLTDGGELGVGTGSTAPAESDTSLEAEVARTPDTAGIHNGLSSGPSFDYWSYEHSWQFDQGEANDNLTELAIFDAASGGNMWTRQLLRDSGGSATTITKTSDDILQIVYELRVYPEKTVRTSTLTIDGTSTTISRQPQNIDSQNEWGRQFSFGSRGFLRAFGAWAAANAKMWEDKTPPGDFTSEGPADTSTSEEVGGSNLAVQAYTGGTFQRDIEAILQVDEANFASGIGAVCLSLWGGNDDYPFISFFAPAIPKENTDELTLQVRHSWARQSV